MRLETYRHRDTSRGRLRERDKQRVGVRWQEKDIKNVLVSETQERIAVLL